MRINFNPGLTIKTKDKQVLKASAEQLADAGKLIWKGVRKGQQFMVDSYIPQTLPKKYESGEELVKWTKAKKGECFKKNILGVYKLNEHGKEIIKGVLANIGLPENASLERFVFRTIGKLNGVR